jgi:hypothetical protein
MFPYFTPRTAVWEVIAHRNRLVCSNIPLRGGFVIAVWTESKSSRRLASRIPPLMKQNKFRKRAIATLLDKLVHDVGEFYLAGCLNIANEDRQVRVKRQFRTGGPRDRKVTKEHLATLGG